MVFCNIFEEDNVKIDDDGHNPYFNRWFSAISVKHKEDKEIKTSQSLF